MLSRPGELIAQGLSDVAEVLIGSEQRADLLSLPEFLPEACTMGGLECRLDQSPQVDLGLCLQQAKSFAGLGLPWDCEHALPRSLVPFFNEWLKHDSLIRENVDFVWLGFDRNRVTTAESPFVYFSPSFGKSSFVGRDNQALYQVIAEGLELLAPGIHAKNLIEVQRCLSALPESGEVLLAASLHSRSMSGIRLELRIPTPEIIGFLKDYGWPGDIQWLEETLVKLDANRWHMPLQLEMNSKLQPSISMEFTVSPDDIASSDWRHIIDQFVVLGYCLPEKRTAVVRWIENGLGRQDRQLDLKIRNNGYGDVQAKAYLVVEDTLSLF